MKKILLLCAFVCSPVLTLAQAPATAPPPPKREGTAEFAFVGTTGNASTQTIGLSGEFIARPDQWVITNKAAFVRNEAESVLTAEFSDDVRMTGLFVDSSDWRLVQIAAITARLTNTFSLKVANTIRYAQKPVPGFKNTDTNTAVALVAKF